MPSPVTADTLARETGVSTRSIYRDIGSLRQAGAEIHGEPGFGYCLVEDGTLPPQTFTRIEIEALALGLSEVTQMGDPALAKAAASAFGKVTATIPSEAQRHLLHAVSQVHRFKPRYAALRDMHLIRQACWREEALWIRYIDKSETTTEREVWPLAIVYFDDMLVLLAWCRLREGFRIFRAERIAQVVATDATFRPRRVALLRQYLAQLASS